MARHLPLFGHERDARLISFWIKELHNDIADIKVMYWRRKGNQEKSFYGSSLGAFLWETPVAVPCAIQLDEQQWTQQNSIHDVSQTAQFYFHIPELESLEIKIDIGDVLEWNGKFWLIDSTNESEHWAGVNPNTTLTDRKAGLNVSIVAMAHHTNAKTLGIIG